MDQRAHGQLWPPQVGDYARIRQNGTLGEIIEIAVHGDVAEYTVNILAPDPNGISACDLEDLTPVWPIEWMRWSYEARQ